MPFWPAFLSAAVCCLHSLLQLKFPSDQHWAAPDKGAESSVSTVRQYLCVKGFSCHWKGVCSQQGWSLYPGLTMPEPPCALGISCQQGWMSGFVAIPSSAAPRLVVQGAAMRCAQTDLARCWLPPGWLRDLCTRGRYVPGHLPASASEQSALTEGEPGRKSGTWCFKPRRGNCTLLKTFIQRLWGWSHSSKQSWEQRLQE